MKKLEIIELRRERPTKSSGSQINYFQNISEEEMKAVKSDTLFIVAADVYGIPYAFNVTKAIKKFTSGKPWTVRMINNLQKAMVGRKIAIEGDELVDADKFIKQVVAETGY